MDSHDQEVDFPQGKDLDRIDPERATGRVAPIIGVLVVSALVMILNETVLTVALPHLMRDLAIGATSAQWLTTGFMLTMAVVIPTTGFLLQRFTTRTLFTAAMVLFLAGTVLAAIAPTFGLILLGRIVQACGTAIILPLLMTTTLTSVAPRHRGSVMGIIAVVISVAPAIGPTLSGLIVDSLSWRWVFGLMLPAATLTLIAGLLLIRTSGETRRVTLDVPSIFLSAFAFGGLVFGLSSIQGLMQGAITPLISLVVGAVSLALFVVRQLRLQRTDSALLDLRPFGVPTFTISVIVVAVAMGTMLGTVMVLPVHLQLGMGLTTLVTGLIMLPGGLAQGLLSPFIGRIYDAVGPRPLVIPGAILLVAGQWWLSRLSADTAVGTTVATYAVFSIGMALVMTPLMTASLSSLPPQLYGHGSAILNTLQQLAGAIGIAILIATMTVAATAATTAGAPPALAQTTGTQSAFVAGGVLALIALVAAPFIGRAKRDGSAAEIEVREPADVKA